MQKKIHFYSAESRQNSAKLKYARIFFMLRRSLTYQKLVQAERKTKWIHSFLFPKRCLTYQKIEQVEDRNNNHQGSCWELKTTLSKLKWILISLFTLHFMAITHYHLAYYSGEECRRLFTNSSLSSLLLKPYSLY